MTVTTPTIVVGVDGSDSSRQALDWAVEEATRRHRPLQVLCAWQSDYSEKTVAPVTRRIEEASGAIVEAAAAHARTESPGLEVATSTVHAQAASALIAVSRRADTVVVGARGVGAVTEALLGSTSMQLAAYASCPVVVVREHAGGRAAAARRVVVGVDGSETAAEATGYAFEQASERGLGLTVVHTWNANVYTSGLAMSVLVEPWDELVAEQERITDEATARWTEKFPTVDVRTQVTQGRAADVLVEASENGELVVVGSRGRGGFRGLLLGSVSRSVLHRAHCPVAVVRPFSPADSDDPEDTTH